MYDPIRCTQTQWSNSGVMERLAQHHFNQHPNCQFVEVIEHGGWFFGFRRDMSCWRTANDMAVLTHPFPQPDGYSGKCVQYPDVN